MKPILFPKLKLPDPGSSVAPTLGHPLVDDYLESVHARLRANSTLAVVYDLKVFFTVIDVDPLDVRRRHVLEFIRVQRTGSMARARFRQLGAEAPSGKITRYAGLVSLGQSRSAGFLRCLRRSCGSPSPGL